MGMKRDSKGVEERRGNRQKGHRCRKRQGRDRRGIPAQACVLCSLICSMPSLRSADGFASLVLVFGLSINAVLHSDIANVARDLDVVDGFCGEGAIHKCAAQQGFRAEAFDKFRVPGVTDSCFSHSCEDMTLEIGFQRVLRLVLRLRIGGLLTMGSPCSSFVQLNAKNCKRKACNDFRGDETYKPVQVGNLLATASAFLMVLAHLRDVHVAIENPPGSTIWKFSPITEALHICHAHSVVTPHCAWSREAIGKRIKKYFRFSCSASWIQTLRRRCPCGRKGHFTLTVLTMVNGRKRFTGKRAALLKSAAYPTSLGKAIIRAWRESSSNSTNVLRSAGDGCTCHWLTPAAGKKRQKKTQKKTQEKTQEPAWLSPAASSSMKSQMKSQMKPQEPAWLRPSPNSSQYQAEFGSPAWLQISPGTLKSLKS